MGKIALIGALLTARSGKQSRRQIGGIVRGTPAAERYGVWRLFERQAT